MGFSIKEYWSGLLFPPSGDIPDPGIKSRFPALQADSLPTELWGKPFTVHNIYILYYIYYKGPSSQGYGFSRGHVWMWELDCEETECWRNDAFELWCWRRLLRVPWTARRSNQSILKEISPGCSLEGLMLTLKVQDFGHLMQRADSFEKTLMLEKIEGRRRRG